MKQLLTITLFLMSTICLAQTREIRGTVLDKHTLTPISSATVTLFPGGKQTITDDRGQFYFRETPANAQLMITSIGHESLRVGIEELSTKGYKVLIGPRAIDLKEI